MDGRRTLRVDGGYRQRRYCAVVAFNGQHFDPRQAKRLFGVIAAGGSSQRGLEE